MYKTIPSTYLILTFPILSKSKPSTMKFAIVLTLTLLGLGFSVLGETGQRVKYDNYKVYRFTPHDEDERKVLIQLQESNLGVSC